MSFIYLATPYSDSDPRRMEHRYDMAEEHTAEALKRGYNVFSPIVHNHPLAAKFDMPRTFDFWHRIDYAILAKASELWVVRLHGWEDSKGIAQEIALAKQLSIPVFFFDFMEIPERFDEGDE